MAEGARLESVYTFARIEGSNPSFTAKLASRSIQRGTERLKLHRFKPFLLFCEILVHPLQSPISWGIIGGQTF